MILRVKKISAGMTQGHLTAEKIGAPMTQGDPPSRRKRPDDHPGDVGADNGWHNRVSGNLQAYNVVLMNTL